MQKLFYNNSIRFKRNGHIFTIQQLIAGVNNTENRQRTRVRLSILKRCYGGNYVRTFPRRDKHSTHLFPRRRMCVD